MPKGHLLSLIAFALATLGCSGASASGLPQPWPLAKTVLVVVNGSSPDSIALGRFYIGQRGIPARNVVTIRTTTDDDIAEAAYVADIENEVREAIKATASPIDYIVTMTGVPIRIRESGYSVDGRLATMDSKIVEKFLDEDGGPKAAPNPYYKATTSFKHSVYGIYLVTHLDGYTLDDAKRLVLDASKAKPAKGLFFMDSNGSGPSKGGYGEMEATLAQADDVLRTKRFDSRLEKTSEFVAPPEPLMGYASWGSNDKNFKPDVYHRLRFAPGALAETFVSTSGRTFRHTTGGQSLIADLVAQGVTGVKGYVSEPYTAALARPDILFDRYTSGFNLAESFSIASPLIRWKDVVIGDPLCRPYAKR